MTDPQRRRTPVEYAEELKLEAASIIEKLENKQVPDVTNSNTAEAIALMCAVASGRAGVSEMASSALIGLLAQALIAIQATKMIALGKVYPVINAKGELMFEHGIRWEDGDQPKG